MNKEEIKERIKNELGCDDDIAEEVFNRALEDKVIKVRLNWNFIIGLVYFTGPTMGYLLGFLVTAFLAGKFNFENNLIKNFLKLTFATSFIYILGMFWLGTLIGWDKPIFKLGAQPFLLAELFKILLATFAINQIKKIKKIF